MFFHVYKEIWQSLLRKAVKSLKICLLMSVQFKFLQFYHKFTVESTIFTFLNLNYKFEIFQPKTTKHIWWLYFWKALSQGNLTEGEGAVQLTSLN